MTLNAAIRLDEAWALHNKIASEPDGSPLSQQSPSWLPASTPFDHSAALVKSLIPLAYNIGKAQPQGAKMVEAIYNAMLDSGEVVSIEVANTIMAEYTQCDTCGWPSHSSLHYKECLA